MIQVLNADGKAQFTMPLNFIKIRFGDDKLDKQISGLQKKDL